MKKINIIKKFSDILQLPYDVVGGLPKISLYGNCELYIENHKGIVAFSENLIMIKAKKTIIEICGNEMKISKLSKSSIYVKGDIYGVVYQF